jgi:transcriptional regulator with XRE-family HTH domain
MVATNELGAFLRSRREQLSPADLGIRATGRRRTPGLRREEVAGLAGLSIDYLVRLEQGRDRNPSASVVNALAEALRLEPIERAHLAKLATCASSPESCPMGSGPVDTVALTVRTLLGRLDPTPAAVVGPWYQLIAFNRAWDRLMRPSGLLDESSPNLARFTFLDVRAHSALLDWVEFADEQVAVLRDSSVRWRHDARLAVLLDELLTVPEFAERWRAHDIARKPRGPRRIVHPDGGELRLDSEVLLLSDETDQRLIAWLPSDGATNVALERICDDSRPGTLRIVG